MTIHAGTLTEQRIAHIMDMMRRWEWKRGKSAGDLATTWGLAVSTVEELSSEASKRVRAEVTDPERVSGTVGSALSKVLHDSMDDGDRKSVIDASKAWAQIVGAMAPQRVDVTSRGEPTPADAQRILREKFAVRPDVASEDDGKDGSGEG